MSPPTWLPSALHPVLARLTTLTPGVALVCGLAAVLFGGALWRFVSIGAGLAIGGWTGWQVGVWTQSNGIGWVAAIAAGLGLAVIFYLVERLALAALGGSVAIQLATWGWPLARHVPADIVVLGVAGLVGAILAGLLHRRAIQALSAVAGAALVAWALGYPGHPGILLVLGIGGAVFQARSGRSAPAAPRAVKRGKR